MSSLVAAGWPGPAAGSAAGALGHAMRLGRDIIGEAGRLFADYGPLVAVTGGDLRRQPALARWVLVQGADLYREVVTRPEDFHKPPLNKQLSPQGDGLNERQQALQRWGAGLFNLNGEEHKEHRRILMPAFHHEAVARYCQAMEAIADERLAAWRPGESIDVAREVRMLTLRITQRCLLGNDVGEAAAGGIGKLTQRTLRLILSPAVYLWPVDVPGTPYWHFLNVVQRADRLAHDLVEARRRAGGEGLDLVSLLLQARTDDGLPLAADRIVEHVGVMLIAGHEPTSSTLMWLLLLLSQHPRVAEDLLDELQGELRGSSPTLAQLESLPFLDAVIRETMRVLAPVPMNARVVARDTELRGHSLPAGTQLIVSLYHTHRSPDVFERPAAFDPYRWETCKPAPYEFNPFGIGPRTCIGAPFAMAELKILLATMLQRFRLELLPGTRVDRAARITLTVKGALPMKVNRQDRQYRRGAGTLRGSVRDMLELADAA